MSIMLIVIKDFMDTVRECTGMLRQLNYDSKPTWISIDDLTAQSVPSQRPSGQK